MIHKALQLSTRIFFCGFIFHNYHYSIWVILPDAIALDTGLVCVRCGHKAKETGK